jgi:hypothetical protein
VFEHACKLGLEGIITKRIEPALQIRPGKMLDKGAQSE